jgi:hypothetical protein
MRFLIHGAVPAAVGEALSARAHVCHALPELSTGAAPVEDIGDPVVLLPALDKRQWNLVTTDRGLVNLVYEKKVSFGGVIVLLLDPAAGADPQVAVARLFERYRRLAPRRLYTVTPNRVKIRQLPGGG